ncbi:MAG: glycosyltransferase family 2 protein [Bacteroidales bacterium]|nr:glycosyltransferase family 2 protein [Bacteroidales bacterium]
MTIPQITSSKIKAPEDFKFSVLIPTWNNLPHLRLTIGSIIKNSRYRHQIIIHINEGSDGTLDWVKSKNFSYSYSEQNVGVCYAFNAAAALAESDYLLLIDDDNYLLPDWDYYLWEGAQKLGHIYFSLSGTKIEPRKTFNPCVIAPKDFGSTPKNFDEQKLLADYLKFEHADWNGSSWYPLLVHKKIWHLVGGLSTEFTPGMYSDPDFMMKLWQAGVRIFMGVSNSRSYHFISKSVRRVKKNNGRKQFLKKWGMSNSTFRTEYLRMGSPYSGSLSEPENTLNLKMKKLKDAIKLFFTP